ncbi:MULTISPECIES: LysM peptidoglycan-binding domain-containing protein [Lacticaseibacillus]|uniref:CAP domain-containing protein n=1 Tax=Lacticaseibacillus zeae subsp. silagei TaxID=3068307 RepID=A0ABD7Z6H6_LACZE|nr:MULTISPECIES: LysM domain-containing protein [Lacticaseibacillus]OFS00529.1 peptidoglycan-binding protein LysM [Lactobacillus sp. HMSC068F07]MDE3282830.1 CAP domain-containing protein [Lacticaseibacillus casei]MDE3315630.1 CAP domain-containing protein [Lacticaseibacillus zeae]WLV82689.1 CAP domain-containing protein [Lacticaseibacillus sp. NCIMB 15475]WLV87481.1 CAP domain-containing protein [Lacticaseibacillus sp. NCIMB 15474]
MGRQQRFLAAVGDRAHKVTLVHSKHHGWLAVGLTAFALGVTGVGLSNQGQVVHASEQQPSAQQTKTNNGRVWKLRPVSEIEAQLKASGKTVYDIQWGDTLSTISEAMNNSGYTTSVERLAAINRIANVDLIYAGAKLALQGNGANATVTTQNAAGTNQTFNLNPAKPAIASGAKQAETKYTVVGGSNGSTPTGNTNLASSGQSGNTTTTPNSTGNGETPTNDAAAKKALEEAAAAKAKAEAEKAAAEKAKAEAEAKLTALLNEENNQTLTSLQSKRTAAQTAVDTAKAKVDATQNKLQNAQAAAKQAQATFDQANAAVTAKQNEVDQANSAVKDLTDQITSLQTQLNTLAGQVKNDPTSQAQVVDVKAKLAVAQEKITVYEGQLADAKSALTQAQQAASQANQNLTTANQNLTAVDNEAKAAQNEFNQAQTTLQSLPTSVTSADSQAAATVKQHLADLNTKLDQLNQTIAGLNEKIATWQQQLAKAQTNVDTANANISKTKDQTAKVDATDHNGTLAEGQQTVAEVQKTVPTIHVPHDTEKNVTINQDESGQTITNLDGYKLVKAGTPVKSVQTLANGDTITTYTTTNTYHKIVHTTVNKTVNVDEAGHTLTNVDGYTQVSISKQVADDTDPKTGDVTTTVTVTIVWRKTNTTPTHQTVNKTVNVDENGKVLTDTTGYTQVSSSKSSSDTTDPATGDVTTTITTTVVWKKNETAPTHFIRNVMVNVDETGKVLTNTDNYEQVSRSVQVSEDTDPKSGNVTTTYTFTIVWKKSTDPGMTITNSIVNKDDEGNVLTSTDGYRLIGSSTSTSTLTLGNWTRKMVTVTYVYHKPQAKTVYKEVDVDEGGRTLTNTTGYTKVSSTPTSATTTDPNNGDTVTTITTTNVWRNDAAAGTIIGKIKSVNDAVTTLIKDQVQVKDERVSVEQGQQYTDNDLTMAVAKKFNVLVNGEQARTGHVQTTLTPYQKAYETVAQRAVEVMYKFAHVRPTNPAPSGTQAVSYVDGEGYMQLNTENISTSSIYKSDVDGDADKLSTLIANAMFKQYIIDERPENNNGQTGGHYQNIINSNYKNIVIGIYVTDNGFYYAASSTVSTGDDSVYRG